MVSVALVAEYRNARRTVSPIVCGRSVFKDSGGKSSRLIAAIPSSSTSSSCTSFPVATATVPIWPAASCTAMSPTLFSNGNGPAAVCDRITSEKARDSGLRRLTRSARVSGSKRQSETRLRAGAEPACCCC